jgi:hypothetical protein
MTDVLTRPKPFPVIQDRSSIRADTAREVFRSAAAICQYLRAEGPLS